MAASCIFCEEQEDVGDMKIYSACEMLDEKPCRPCTEYLELEAQIEQTRKTLEKQLGRKREIRQNINQVHDAMLIRVPREITTYIFELAASVDIPPYVSKTLLEGELYGQLRLGKVCRAWRDIAWGIPQLWNFFFVEIRTIEALPFRLDIARQWLSRSGEYLPLSISIYFNIDDPEDKDRLCDWDQFTPFIGLLNLYSHRWKDLFALGPYFLLEKLSAKDLGAPILENLQLSATGITDEMVFDLGCEQLPRPRSVHFNNVYVPIFRIDWGHVTHLKTDTLLINAFLHKLPQLHELRELRVTGLNMFPYRQPSSVTHLKLESLYIESPNRDRECIPILLDCLILPSLRQLNINLLQDRRTLSKVISLLQQSSCTLSSLSLSHCPRDSHDFLIRLLEYSNSIEELKISNVSKYDGDFLAALRDRLRARDNPDSQPLPLANIQHLVYIPNVPRNVSWKLLLPIFDPSWVSNQPQWKTLSISPLSTSSDDLELEPQELVHKGLDDEVLERLLNLAESGIKLFLPWKMNKNQLLDLMKAKQAARAEMGEMEQ